MTRGEGSKHVLTVKWVSGARVRDRGGLNIASWCVYEGGKRSDGVSLRGLESVLVEG